MDAAPIRTPDHRIRVFVSSTLRELEPERAAARSAIESLRLAPVMFELGARPHPPRSLYRSYLAQSDVFVGIYAERYGWIAPGEEISGLEDEYRLSGNLPALMYLREPSPDREDRLKTMLASIRDDDRTSYKSFRTPAELAELLAADLATLLADRFDAAQAPATAAAGTRTPGGGSVPAPYTATIGRDDDCAAVIGMLRQPEVRLTTIVGPGGMGKSRLAIEVARRWERDGGEVAFALLESVTAPENVLTAIARAIGVRDGGETDLLTSVIGALSDRNLLLVLDNMEHLLDAVPLVARLLAQVPDLTILVTSRSLLRVRAEYAYDLDALAVPPVGASPAEALRTAAVELFVQRARAARADLDLSDEGVRAIAEICRAVDGVPLAIELAAARTRSLSPAEVLSRLGSTLSLLDSGPRDLPERQRTIRATVDWSVALLDESARAALAALSVVTGPFTRDAAEDILTGVPGVDPLTAIDALVDASLLQQRDRAGVRVFALLALVHAYADALDVDPGARQRWVDHYLGFAVDAGELLSGAAQPDTLRRLEAEVENLVGVMRHLLSAHRYADAAELGWALYLFVWLTGMLGLVQTWMTELLASAAAENEPLDARTEAIALYFANAIEFWQRPDADVVSGLERSATLFDGLGYSTGAALARVSLGLALLSQPDGPDVVRAGDELSRAIEGFRAESDRWGEAMALVTRGRLDLLTGDIATAQERFARSLAVAEGEQEPLGIVIARNHLAWSLFLSGRVDDADDAFAQSLEASIVMGHDEGVAYGLEGLAAVSAHRGLAREAGMLLAVAERLRRRVGVLNLTAFSLHTPAIQALRDAGRGAEMDEGRARARDLSAREVLHAVGR
jgi:predicted ATPase